MKRIILIGYMGSGKTTVGKALSKETGMMFYDLDWYIESRMRKTVSQIFAEKGEEGFRKTTAHGMWLMKHLLRKWPKVIEALQHRPTHYNRQLQFVREQEREGNAFVFRPAKPLDVSRTTHDPKEMYRVYQQGREEALQRLEELQQFLANDAPATHEQP